MTKGYRDDDVGKWYRRVVSQNEDVAKAVEKGETTQGMYIVAPDGKLLAYWNQEHVAGALPKLQKFRASSQPVIPKLRQKFTEVNNWANPKMPSGGLVLVAASKIVGKPQWPEDAPRHLREAWGIDTIWVTAEEARALRRDDLPKSLITRIVRFNLGNNTAGEGSTWSKPTFSEPAKVEKPKRLTGHWSVYQMTADLAESEGELPRSYKPAIQIRLKRKGSGEIERFELVAVGTAKGKWPWGATAPEGEYELAVAVRLVHEKEVYHRVTPHGAPRAEGEPYLK